MHDIRVNSPRLPRKRDERHANARATRPLGAHVLIWLLLLLAVNALGGGGALMADRSGALLGMPIELLAQSPFRDYLLPGAILFGLLGIFPLLVAWALWRRPPWAYVGRAGVDGAWLGAVVVGVALIVWILVQMSILRFFLQPILLALGVGIVGVSLLPAVRRHYATPHGSGAKRA
jgi:hypothetical protein